jgi:hypothetical protein
MPLIMADPNSIRTIHQIPIEEHRRYDEDRKTRKDSDFSREEKIIKGHVGLDTLTTTLQSQVDILFGLDEAPGGISAPKGFDSLKGGIFEHDQAVPSLKSEDQIGRISEQITGRKEAYLKKLASTSSPTEFEGEKNSVENEANKLQSLLSEVANINQAMRDASSARAGLLKG